jgi:hypothetical protein
MKAMYMLLALIGAASAIRLDLVNDGISDAVHSAVDATYAVSYQKKPIQHARIRTELLCYMKTCILCLPGKRHRGDLMPHRLAYILHV